MENKVMFSVETNGHKIAVIKEDGKFYAKLDGEVVFTDTSYEVTRSALFEKVWKQL